MMVLMVIAQSKVTAQGQISVPANVRRKLGLGPGSVLEWDEEGENVVVRKAGQYTFDDIHKRLFPNGKPPRKSLKELKKGIEDYMLEHHARD
jgi:antitoxin PrlF